VNRTKKFVVIGLGVGFCLALIEIAFAYSYPYWDHFLILCLCLAPASIIYALPVGGATLGAQLMIASIIAISNALIYGLVFFVIGVIWRVFSREVR
jgi:uncharacterized protein (DUF983 family)